MKQVTFAFLLFGLTSCEYSENDLKEGPGYYKCESNIGRPTLTLDTKTFSVSRDPLNNTALVSFTNLKDGKVYTLHSVEDRDYHCERVTKEQLALGEITE